MFPFNFPTICAIQNGSAQAYVYGPDPIELRWGWAVGTFYDSGLIYLSKTTAEDDCKIFVEGARKISVNKFDI